MGGTNVNQVMDEFKGVRAVKDAGLLLKAGSQ
jgi:hypothetical protein